MIFWDKIVQPQRVVTSQANVTFDHFQIFGTLHTLNLGCSASTMFTGMIKKNVFLNLEVVQYV